MSKKNWIFFFLFKKTYCKKSKSAQVMCFESVCNKKNAFKKKEVISGYLQYLRKVYCKRIHDDLDVARPYLPALSPSYFLFRFLSSPRPMRSSSGWSLITITSALSSCWTSACRGTTMWQWRRAWWMSAVYSGKPGPRVQWALNPWRIHSHSSSAISRLELRQLSATSPPASSDASASCSYPIPLPDVYPVTLALTCFGPGFLLKYVSVTCKRGAGKHGRTCCYRNGINDAYSW